MPTLLRSPLLLALLALAFAIGHGHQGVERFHAHEHGTAPECQDAAGDACAAGGGAASHEQEEGGGQGDAGHGDCCTHGSVAAVLSAPGVVLEVRRSGCDWLPCADVLAPDAPVMGIEHPPQIALG